MTSTSLKTNGNFGNALFMIMAFVWVLIFAIPLLTGDSNTRIDWHHVFKVWVDYSFVFVAFLVNHFLLFPQFLKGKRILYFVMVAILLAVFALVSYYLNQVDAPHMQVLKPPMNGQPGMAPPPGKRPGDMMTPFGNLLIIGILIIGFDDGLSFAGKWLQAEQNKIMLEKENIEHKMSFLQNQVSPHFFMNTLNNIHALVDIDTEEAKEAIIRLSQMMAYLLYESQTSKISLQKEIDFIKSYVELMKLRFSEEVDVRLEIPATLPDIKLPPLLTISYIENAFKHGVSYEKPSFIHIRYVFKEKNLYFEVKNTIHAKAGKPKNSGLGLQNARNRLDLIYAEKYNLEINQYRNELFTVTLKLPT